MTKFKQNIQRVTVGSGGGVVATFPVHNMNEFTVDVINSGSLTIVYSIQTAAIDHCAAWQTVTATSVLTSGCTRNLVTNNHASLCRIDASATAPQTGVKVIVSSIDKA
jgi:hypothetical protein